MRLKLSEEVFSLIKSLSSTEKAYFKKLHAGRANSKLSSAFDRLNSFSEFDEKLLNEDLEKHGIKPSVVYKHLFSSICKALTQYDYGKTEDLKMLEIQNSIMVLYNRDRLSLCLRQVEKGLDFARHNGFYVYELNLLKWQAKARQAFDSYTRDDEDDDHLVAKEIIKNLDLAQDYSYLMTKMSRLLNASDTDSDVIYRFKSEILSHPVFQVDEPNHDFRTPHYTIVCASKFFIGKWEEAVSAGEKGIANAKELHQLRIGRYFQQLSFMLNLCIIYQSLKYQTKYLSMVKRIEKELKGPKMSPRKALVRSYEEQFLLLNIYHEINSGRLNYALGLCSSSWQKVSKKQTVSNQMMQLLLTKALILFLQTDYKKCLVLINELFANKEIEAFISQELKNLKWMELLCTFQMKDESLFEAKFRALKRSLAKNPSGYNWENAILTALYRSFGKSASEQSEIFQELDTFLESTREELRIGLREFDMEYWVKSMATGKPMAVLIKEKYLSN